MQSYIDTFIISGSSIKGIELSPPLELITLVWVIIYISVYVHGSSINRRLASQWYTAIWPTVSENFAYPQDTHMLQDGPVQYLLFASGRVNCSQIIARIMLKPRQDLILRIRDIFRKQVHDRVRIEVSLDPNSSDPFIFAILHNDIASQTYNACHVLKSHTSAMAQTYLPADLFTVFSEHKDVTPLFFSTDPRVHRFLTHPSIIACLESFIISDQSHSKTLHITYRLKQPNCLVHSAYMQFACWLIDNISQVDLRSSVRVKLRMRRRHELEMSN